MSIISLIPIVIIFSIFALKEIANRYEWLAVISAFTGALFVVKPTFSSEVIPALAGVIGGLGAGLAYAYVRKLGIRGENSMIIVAFFSGFTTIMFIFYWYLITCFCAVYQNTQIAFIKDSLLSFVSSILFPFIIYLIPSFLRLISLKLNIFKYEVIYNISGIIPLF